SFPPAAQDPGRGNRVGSAVDRAWNRGPREHRVAVGEPRSYDERNTPMKAPRMLLSAAFALAGPALIAGAAGADDELPPPPPPPTVEVVAGPNWVVVTVTPLGGDAPDTCSIDPYNGTPETQSIPVAPAGNVFVDNVPVGTHTVSAWCPNGGISTATVEITG